MENICTGKKDCPSVRQAVHLLMQANHTHRRVIEKRTTVTGLHRTQHFMLMHISKYDNIPSQKEIAKHFDISPAAVAVTLKKLEQDGYIERTRGADGDTRQNAIRITDKGKNEITATQKYFDYVDNIMFNNFTEEEFNTFISLLDKAINNLRTLDACEEQTAYTGKEASL